MRVSCTALLVVVLANPIASAQDSSFDCPVTLGSNKTLGPPFPQSDHWFGSEALAVRVPHDGKWSTTREGANIAVKVFWWSSAISARGSDLEDYVPGISEQLSVTVRRLDPGKSDAVVTRTTNAHAADLGGWTLLTGIDFPTPGCFEITGAFLGQTLNFVVEVEDVERYLRSRDPAQE